MDENIILPVSLHAEVSLGSTTEGVIQRLNQSEMGQKWFFAVNSSSVYLRKVKNKHQKTFSQSIPVQLSCLFN